MDELRQRVRERLRNDLQLMGAERYLHDPALMAGVEEVLRHGVDMAGGRGLVLPELLGDPKEAAEADPNCNNFGGLSRN